MVDKSKITTAGKVAANQVIMERKARANLPMPCIKLKADPKNITDKTMDKNFLRVVTRIVVTAEVKACSRYTPNIQTTCTK